MTHPVLSNTRSKRDMPEGDRHLFTIDPTKAWKCVFDDKEEHDRSVHIPAKKPTDK